MPTYPDRPDLALRIGISGARTLEADQVPRLDEQLRAVLDLAKSETKKLAENDPAVRAAYCHKPNEAPNPILRFLSPLARGADRLAARQAVAAGYALHVPMPFPLGAYEKDFDTPEDLAEFHELLPMAGEDWLALDGDHGPEMNRSYEAVGRYVVRHADFLIAIWDGGPGAGRGGAAEIVRYALLTGVPVWWLHATEDREPAWVADILDVRHPPAHPVDAEAALKNHLKALIVPPPPCPRHRHGAIGQLSGLLQGKQFSPESDHFAERPLKKHWIWRAYATMIRWTSGLNPPWTQPRPPGDPVARYWFDRYEPVDARAGEYAARYRSAYVWQFFLGTLAVILGAAALVLWGFMGETAGFLRELLHFLELVFIAGELGALVLIVTLVFLGNRWDWHARSIEYRLLAELCRKQQALAPLGWALPITGVRRTAMQDRPASDRAAWVPWLFAAEQRAAPLPHGDVRQATQGDPRSAILDELILEQSTYHKDRAEMAEAAGHTLERLGEFLFGLVFVCVVIKVVLAAAIGQTDWSVAFGYLATILPAVSAAFFGVRAYAELQVLAEQSRHMQAELKRSHDRVLRLDVARPLVSQDLGSEAASVAALMLQDLEGWAQLCRVKGVELP